MLVTGAAVTVTGTVADTVAGVTPEGAVYVYVAVTDPTAVPRKLNPVESEFPVAIDGEPRGDHAIIAGAMALLF